MVSIFVPLAYIGFLFGSLALFSRIYRGRQSRQRKENLWFKHHKARELYVSLLSMDPIPPRQILVAGLMNRAKEDVKLIWQIRDAKQAMGQLLQKGQIGDKIWESLLAAEKELEQEILEVVQEANTFQPGYGQHIFAIVSDMAQHEKFKEVYESIPKLREQFATETEETTILGPYSHVSPSQLTLSPSNPIQPFSAPVSVALEKQSTQGTTTDDEKVLPAAPPKDLPIAPPSPKPEAASVSVAPSTPSKDSPALPDKRGDAVPGSNDQKSADVSGDEGEEEDEDEATHGGAPSTTGTPSSKQARKRANQKKKKKGKR